MIPAQTFSRASSEHPDRNEDAILVLVEETPPGSTPVFAMIDGMGGHQRFDDDGTLISGREAAGTIRQVLIEDLAALPRDIDAAPNGAAQAQVTAAIGRAHRELLRGLNGDGALSLSHRVGAVLTVAVVCEDGARLLIAQVGDTRGYLYTGGELIQLCEDEDNIQYLVKGGSLSAADGQRLTELLNQYDGVTEPTIAGVITVQDQPYPAYLAWRWFITGNAALGILPANVVIHAMGIHPADPVPQVSRIEIAPGDTLVMLSDGVYKNLSEAEIIAGLQPSGDRAVFLGEAAYARSQDAGNRRRTIDDVSALVVTF